MEQEDDDSSTTIDPEGNVLLVVGGANLDGISFRYRVSTAKLSSISNYFRALFDPSKFSEGRGLADQLNGLEKPTPDSTARKRCPTVTILDAEIPLEKSSKPVLDAFFRCAHEPNIQHHLDGWSFSHIYLLAVTADRFMAREAVRSTMEGIRHHPKYSARSSRKHKSDVSERMCRQKLIVGVWYDFQEWVSFYSWRLVIQGSRKWVETECQISTESAEELDLWNLPEGLEDELEDRRAYVLNTLADVQDTLVGKYLAKERVCKSGLDTSLQCDMFQLGQALRFLHRKQFVSLRSSVGEQTSKPKCSDSLSKLCAALMECPSYQLDSFHQNCGLRSRLVRCVEVVQYLISTDAYIGVCLECWRKDRVDHSWSKPANGRLSSTPSHSKTASAMKIHDHGSAMVHYLTTGSLINGCEAGWRPQSWQFHWMHD